jgi:hypothetical protein
MAFHEFSDLFEFHQSEHLKPLIDLFVWASHKELLGLNGRTERSAVGDEYLVEILIAAQGPI